MVISKGGQYKESDRLRRQMQIMKNIIDTLDKIVDIYYHNKREKAMNTLEDDLSLLLFKYTNSPKFNPDKEED